MSNISHYPHDKLVRKFLEDKSVAIDLLKEHLPSKVLELRSINAKGYFRNSCQR